MTEASMQKFENGHNTIENFQIKKYDLQSFQATVKTKLTT